MLTISTKNIGIMDISSASSKTRTKDDKKNNDCFADIMNMSANNESKVPETKAQDTKVADSKSNIKDVNSNKGDDNQYNTDKVAGDKNTDKQASMKTGEEEVDNTIADVSVNDKEAVEDNLLTEDLAEKLGAIINELISFIKEQLNITDEQINQNLDKMGLDIADLLHPEQLKEFTLAVENATEVDLLIDENIADTVNTFIGKLEELMSEFDSSLDVKKVVSEFKKIVDPNYVSDTDNQENVPETVTYNVETADNTNDSFDTSSEGFSFETDGRDEKTADSRVNNNLNQAINQVFENENIVVDELSESTETVNTADVVRQIIDEIKTNVTKDTRMLEVQLNPENLGKITINVSEKEGAMHARIIAENEAAKNAIEANLAVLKDEFMNRELKVEAIEVMIGTYDSFNGQQDAMDENQAGADSSRKQTALNLDEEIETDELSLSEKLEVEMMRMSGNRVSYTV